MEEGLQPRARRPSLKKHVSVNWKEKLRENCYKRVRDERSRLLWKMRLPSSMDESLNQKEFIMSAFEDIVSDELKKLKDSFLYDHLKISTADSDVDDALWEYDGGESQNASDEGEQEEILLEMQKIFYEDLREGPVKRESESDYGTWEDEEDEYLARAVYEHMNLNDEKVHKEMWCPICKKGELEENCHLIYCTLCQFQLNRGCEVNLDLLRDQLANAHSQHLDRGCRLKPNFCLESKFGITALYISCDGCSTFEVVI